MQHEHFNRSRVFVACALSRLAALWQEGSKHGGGLGSYGRVRSWCEADINEILKELPKLTQDEKRQLLNVLDRELSGEPEEDSPEGLAAIERGIRSLEAGERTHTLEEAR